MRSRPHGRKPTLALWMLVAMADIAVLIATAGLLTVLVFVAGLVTVAGVVVAFWQLQHRATPATTRRIGPVVSRAPAAVGRRKV